MFKGRGIVHDIGSSYPEPVKLFITSWEQILLLLTNGLAYQLVNNWVNFVLQKVSK